MDLHERPQQEERHRLLDVGQQGECAVAGPGLCESRPALEA